jgi:hypothetical protein
MFDDFEKVNEVLDAGEFIHACHRLGKHTDVGLASMANQLKKALRIYDLDEFATFDVTQRLPTQKYCIRCGEFRKQGEVKTNELCGKNGCDSPLRDELAFEDLISTLVWTSILKDLSISSMAMQDLSFTLNDVLTRMPTIRPYRSLSYRGKDSYVHQCYFITHLIFVMSRWGAVRLSPSPLFVEEYLFLLFNMEVVIQLGDAELVGEFLHSLHIFGVKSTHWVMQKGYYYLLRNEGVGRMRGNWAASTAEFYARYHTAFCGIIGIAELQFDSTWERIGLYDHHFSSMHAK